MIVELLLKIKPLLSSHRVNWPCIKNFPDSELRISQRKLYVLKSGYKDVLLKEIVEVLEKYQDYITDLKKEGCSIVGYSRNKITSKNRDEAVKSLQNMITGLKSRSLVERIYVTFSCNAKTPINRRDLKKNMIIGELSGVNGDAQDLIKELAKMSKVCLVVIDSAGLTTNMSDLESFIREHRNIEKIIIDTLAHDNQVDEDTSDGWPFTFDIPTAKLKEIGSLINDSRKTVPVTFNSKWDGPIKNSGGNRGVDWLDFFKYMVPTLFVPALENEAAKRPLLLLCKASLAIMTWEVTEGDLKQFE